MEEKDNNQQENIETNQEDLAAAWAEMLQQEDTLKENSKDAENEKTQEEKTSDSQEDLAATWASMLENKQNQEENKEESKSSEETSTTQSLPSDLQRKLSLLLDIPINITVEIGSKVMAIEDILKLSPSSVIDLDRYINEPIDLKVNGVLVAKGELYQVEDQFAIKIKEILTKEERVNLISRQYTRG
ncbi:MAG: FliM/FliN family flagellar motor switch protein [Sulfurihydrogenibium sp.]|uniref:FliM/FliN family flagellar motor switch protein n=2 Tax=Sulfurihydrogenibium sp. TaxID=2053621 RepID=UPI000CB70003|nr:MAG: flagellar motor switch protein FliN [Sulfurihydrogenibium sp.]